jgi:hypothetical protein
MTNALVKCRQHYRIIRISKSVSYWYREFNRGRDSLEDEPHPGRRTTAPHNEMVDRVRKIIKENPRLTYSRLQNFGNWFLSILYP